MLVAEAIGEVELKVRRQKNGQLGVGQRSHVVALPSWRGACPVQLTSGWLWFRAWLARRRYYAGRMSSPPEGGPLFAVLARARFGLGMAPPRISAARKRDFEARSLSPRKGGARLYVANGMAREATQELGGWKSPSVTEGVYAKAHPKEVAPEMRAALAAACAG